MCCLFGLLDFRRVFSTHAKNKILSVLSQECEERGTDAAGIAYNFGGRLRIYKRPVPAHQLHIRIPNGVSVVMGHTRLATQGSEKQNYNNHPFSGCCHNQTFALAHNGVLWNDKLLQKNLPCTKIQTDSYVAVQLLEQQGRLDFDSLKYMAETVEGSFTFTVLDADNNLYVVKGNNPFVLFDYEGFALYASTRAILEKTVKRLRLGLPCSIREPKQGEIAKIDAQGGRTISYFVPQDTDDVWHPCYYSMGLEPDSYPFGLDELITVAKTRGITPDEVQVLFDYGCSCEEIEELLCNPSILHEIAAELLHSY